MKIRNRIAFRFTLLAGILLLSTFAMIYFFNYRYAENDFRDRLKERGLITAQAYLEEDELNARIYREIKQQHLRTLPYEEEVLIPVHGRDSLRNLAGYERSFLQRALRDSSAFERDGNGYHYAMYYPDNQGTYLVVLSAQDPRGKARLRNLLHTLLIAFVLSLGLIYGLSLQTARQALEPISQIIAKVNRIRASQLHLRLPYGRNEDELNHLARTFNQMLDRLETAFDLQRNFVSNASHELRNPLTAIMGQTEVSLRKARTAGEYQKALEIVADEAARLDALITGLLQLAKAGMDGHKLVLEELRADELLVEVKTEFARTHPGSELRLILDQLPEDPGAITLFGHAALLKVALHNLLDNAVKFSSGAPVTMALYNVREQVVFAITDQGMGIPLKERQKVTEPFYRAENARRHSGFGVGLSLTERIIGIHGGELKLEEARPQGTIARVSIPQYQ